MVSSWKKIIRKEDKKTQLLLEAVVLQILAGQVEKLDIKPLAGHP